jgi:hypothetical protein
MSLPAVSKHLKVLVHAGLVKGNREAQWRSCRLDAGPLKDAAEWLEHYRHFWEQRFDSLADYLDELQAKEEKDGHNQASSRLSNGAKITGGAGRAHCSTSPNIWLAIDHPSSRRKAGTHPAAAPNASRQWNCLTNDHRLVRRIGSMSTTAGS